MAGDAIAGMAAYQGLNCTLSCAQSQCSPDVSGSKGMEPVLMDHALVHALGAAFAQSLVGNCNYPQLDKVVKCVLSASYTGLTLQLSPSSVACFLDMRNGEWGVALVKKHFDRQQDVNCPVVLLRQSAVDYEGEQAQLLQPAPAQAGHAAQANRSSCTTAAGDSQSPAFPNSQQSSASQCNDRHLCGYWERNTVPHRLPPCAAAASQHQPPSSGLVSISDDSPHAATNALPHERDSAPLDERRWTSPCQQQVRAHSGAAAAQDQSQNQQLLPRRQPSSPAVNAVSTAASSATSDAHLLCIPLLVDLSLELISDLLLFASKEDADTEQIFDKWLDAAAVHASVGMLQLHVDTKLPPAMADAQMRNALLLSLMVGPLCLQQACSMLRHMATEAGVLEQQGGCAFDYVPGHGFVAAPLVSPQDSGFSFLDSASASGESVNQEVDDEWLEESEFESYESFADADDWQLASSLALVSTGMDLAQGVALGEHNHVLRDAHTLLEFVQQVAGMPLEQLVRLPAERLTAVLVIAAELQRRLGTEAQDYATLQRLQRQLSCSERTDAETDSQTDTQTLEGSQRSSVSGGRCSMLGEHGLQGGAGRPDDDEQGDLGLPISPPEANAESNDDDATSGAMQPLRGTRPMDDRAQGRVRTMADTPCSSSGAPSAGLHLATGQSEQSALQQNLPGGVQSGIEGPWAATSSSDGANDAAVQQFALGFKTLADLTVPLGSAPHSKGMLQVALHDTFFAESDFEHRFVHWRHGRSRKYERQQQLLTMMVLVSIALLAAFSSAPVQQAMLGPCCRYLLLHRLARIFLDILPSNLLASNASQGAVVREGIRCLVYLSEGCFFLPMYLRVCVQHLEGGALAVFLASMTAAVAVLCGNMAGGMRVVLIRPTLQTALTALLALGGLPLLLTEGKVAYLGSFSIALFAAYWAGLRRVSTLEDRQRKQYQAQVYSVLRREQHGRVPAALQ